MWHEARKIEKRIRGIMIDYRKRAERRTAYYERMREDPHQLLHLHGLKCKLYLDSRSEKPSEESQLVPWQGDAEILIDRFDARSHLDYLPDTIPKVPANSDPEEENELNYERYRTLVNIDATGVTEEAYLKQLAIEEWYGKKQAEKAKAEKEELAKKKASIGYKYEGSSVLSDESDKSDDESDLSDIDISVNVNELTDEQKTSLDSLATTFGIASKFYCRQLLKEKKESEFAKILEEEEEERSKLSGRRRKRARRSLREKQKALRTTSPPSYAVRGSPTYDPYSPPGRRTHSRSSSSRSRSPDGHGKIEYITEFGGASSSPEKPISLSSRDKDHRPASSRSRQAQRRDSDRHRSRERRGTGKSRSRSRSRHRRRSRTRSRSRSPRRSRSRNRERSRSRSRSRDNYYRKGRSKHSRRSRSYSSRSRSRSWSRSRSRSRSRSPRSSSSSVTRKFESSGSKKPLGATATNEKPKLTPQERLKLRMQKQLSKQIKQDKQSEKKKKDDKEKERMDRENDIYEIQRKIRYRPRNEFSYGRDRSPDRSPPRRTRGRSSSRSPSKSPRTRAYEEIGWEV